MAIMTIIETIVIIIIIIHSAPDRRHWPEASTISSLFAQLDVEKGNDPERVRDAWYSTA